MDKEQGTQQMRYERVAAAFFGTPWAILPEKLIEIRAILKSRLAGERPDPQTVRAAVAMRRSSGASRSGSIAILPVMGVICQRVGMMEEASGGVSTEEIGANLDALVNDKTVASIVMLFDSGGGSVYGVEELARKMASLRARKPITGMIDSVCASAAYWLARSAARSPSRSADCVARLVCWPRTKITPGRPTRPA